MASSTVEPILLAFTLVLVILMMCANFYFLVYYQHAADTYFGNSVPTKILLVKTFHLTPTGRWSAS